MTHNELNNFTWDELSNFTWGDLSLDKYELIAGLHAKHIYDFLISLLK